MTNEQVIDKIKKLLELAASPETAEAELAMQRAKQLMEKYCVDVKSNPDEQVIRYDWWICPIAMDAAHRYFPNIVWNITPLFGCHALVNSATRDMKVYGFRANLTIARYAIDSLMAQGQIAFRKGYKLNRSITFADEFWKGFAAGLRKKYSEQTKPVTEQGIVLYDSVKQHVDALAGVPWNPGQQSTGMGRDYGVAAGQDANIRDGISDTSSRGNLLR